MYLDVIENPVEYQNLLSDDTLKRLRSKTRKLKEFVYERIRPSIPNSSRLRRYVKVRTVTKNVCKLNTKRVRLNKVTQHKKKYFLNCSVWVNQRIIKLNYRAKYLILMQGIFMVEAILKVHVCCLKYHH